MRTEAAVFVMAILGASSAFVTSPASMALRRPLVPVVRAGARLAQLKMETSDSSSALDHEPSSLIKRSPFKTNIINDGALLEVRAMANLKVLSVPIDTISAFRFWPKSDRALALLLVSRGKQQVVPLPISDEVKDVLQARLEELETNAPASVALRRLRDVLPATGRSLATPEETAGFIASITGTAPVNASSSPPSGANSTAAAAEDKAPNAQREKQHWVLIAEDIENGLDKRMANREAHLAFIKAQPAGRVLLGGPLLQRAGAPPKAGRAGSMVGSMIVFSGTKKEVEEAIAADPYVKAGLFESSRLMPWKWAIGTVSDGKEATPEEAICLVECKDKTGALDTRMATRDAHLAYLKAKGDIVLAAGPMLDEGGKMCGSLVFVRGEEGDGKAFAEGDPYGKAGLFESVTVTRWKRVVDNREAAYNPTPFKA